MAVAFVRQQQLSPTGTTTHTVSITTVTATNAVFVQTTTYGGPLTGVTLGGTALIECLNGGVAGGHQDRGTDAAYLQTWYLCNVTGGSSVSLVLTSSASTSVTGNLSEYSGMGSSLTYAFYWLDDSVSGNNGTPNPGAIVGGGTKLLSLWQMSDFLGTTPSSYPTGYTALTASTTAGWWGAFRSAPVSETPTGAVSSQDWNCVCVVFDLGVVAATASGSITVAGTATPRAAGSSAATATVGGTATAKAGTTSSGTVSVTGTATPKAVATSSGAVSVTGAATASAGASASGTLIATGTAAMTIAAAGEIDAAGTATAAAAAASFTDGFTENWSDSWTNSTLYVGGVVTGAAGALATAQAAFTGSAAGHGAASTSGVLSVTGVVTAGASASAAGVLTTSGAAPSSATVTSAGAVTATATAIGTASPTAQGALTIAGGATARASANATGSISSTGAATWSTSAHGFISAGGTATPIVSSRTNDWRIFNKEWSRAWGDPPAQFGGSALPSFVATGNVSAAGIAVAAAAATAAGGIEVSATGRGVRDSRTLSGRATFVLDLASVAITSLAGRATVQPALSD